jgi:uncharacterized protein (DUF488 family)
MPAKEIWTIGHSTRSLEEFVKMLQAFSIHAVADIRTYPGSRRYPHFNKEALQQSLPNNNIEYVHMPSLGGRRTSRADSPNTEWKNAGFRGYADYMETDDFAKAAAQLMQMASTRRTAYMCSEAVWWKCHRAMVSDYLKSQGWKVQHIMTKEKGEEHRYTKPARIVEGELTYHGFFS